MHVSVEESLYYLSLVSKWITKFIHCQVTLTNGFKKVVAQSHHDQAKPKGWGEVREFWINSAKVIIKVTEKSEISSSD